VEGADLLLFLPLALNEDYVSRIRNLIVHNKEMSKSKRIESAITESLNEVEALQTQGIEYIKRITLTFPTSLVFLTKPLELSTFQASLIREARKLGLAEDYLKAFPDAFRKFTRELANDDRGRLIIHNPNKVLRLSRVVLIEHLFWFLSDSAYSKLRDEHVHFGVFLPVSYYLYLTAEAEKYDVIKRSPDHIWRRNLDPILPGLALAIIQLKREIKERCLPDKPEEIALPVCERAFFYELLERATSNPLCSKYLVAYLNLIAIWLSRLVQNDLYTGLTAFSAFYGKTKATLGIHKARKKAIFKQTLKFMDEYLKSKDILVSFKLSSNDFYRNRHKILKHETLQKHKYFLSYVKRPFKRGKLRSLEELFFKDMESELEYFKKALKVLQLRDLIAGPDVAGVEEYVPNWIGVRYVRSVIKIMKEANLRGSISYHAGESYFNPLNGLRSLYEAVVLGNMESTDLVKDRVAHALALGEERLLDREEPLWEAAFDLAMAVSVVQYVGAHELSPALNQALSAVLTSLKTEADELPADPPIFLEFWKDLYDQDKLTALLFYGVEKLPLSSQLYDPGYVDDHEVKLFINYWKSWHKIERRINLLDLLERYISKKRIKELIEVIQEHLLKEMKSRGIIVESCPVSNMLIGHLDKHPLKKFLESGIEVVIGSDDPGVLNTDIALDYALYYAFRKELGVRV